MVMLLLLVLDVLLLFQMMILMLMFRTVDTANETLPCKAIFLSHLYHLLPLHEAVFDFCHPGGWRLNGHDQLHL